MGFIGSFWYGLTLPWRSARLIASRPSLMFWSSLPVVISLGIYIWIIGKLQSEAKTWIIHSFMSWGWNPEGWGAALILIFSKLLLLIVSALTFSIMASIAASPFNDFLAEATEPLSTPPLAKSEMTSLGERVRLIAIDVMKTIFATMASVAAILLSWIPLVNLVAFSIAFLLISFQYVSYPQTRRGEGVREGIAFLFRHLFSCLGFGASLSFLFAIPFASCLMIPLAVVGGTLLYGRAQVNSSLPRLR